MKGPLPLIGDPAPNPQVDLSKSLSSLSVQEEGAAPLSAMIASTAGCLKGSLQKAHCSCKEGVNYK